MSGPPLFTNTSDSGFLLLLLLLLLFSLSSYVPKNMCCCLILLLIVLLRYLRLGVNYLFLHDGMNHYLFGLNPTFRQ